MSAHEVAAHREREEQAAFAAMVTSSGISLAELVNLIEPAGRTHIAAAVEAWCEQQARVAMSRAGRAGAWR